MHTADRPLFSAIQTTTNTLTTRDRHLSTRKAKTAVKDKGMLAGAKTVRVCAPPSGQRVKARHVSLDAEAAPHRGSTQILTMGAGVAGKIATRMTAGHAMTTHNLPPGRIEGYCGKTKPRIAWPSSLGRLLAVAPGGGCIRPSSIPPITRLGLPYKSTFLRSVSAITLRA